MAWQQIDDPLHNMLPSTTLAAVPVVVMLVALGFLHNKTHIAARLVRAWTPWLILTVLVFVVVFVGGLPVVCVALHPDGGEVRLAG